MKLATIAAAAASLAVAAGGASAATMFQNSGTTLSLTPVANVAQTFDAGTANGGGYYYTFNTLGRYLVDFTDTGSLNATPLDNPFTVTTGSVAGAGTTVATSKFATIASGAKATLAAGTYTLYVPTTTVGQGLSGTVSVAAAAVPEPASWALMIIGVAGIGGAIRRRSGTALAASA